MGCGDDPPQASSISLHALCDMRPVLGRWRYASGFPRRSRWNSRKLDATWQARGKQENTNSPKPLGQRKLERTCENRDNSRKQRKLEPAEAVWPFGSRNHDDSRKLMDNWIQLDNPRNPRKLLKPMKDARLRKTWDFQEN